MPTHKKCAPGLSPRTSRRLRNAPVRRSDLISLRGAPNKNFQLKERRRDLRRCCQVGGFAQRTTRNTDVNLGRPRALARATPSLITTNYNWLLGFPLCPIFFLSGAPVKLSSDCVLGHRGGPNGQRPLPHRANRYGKWAPLSERWKPPSATFLYAADRTAEPEATKQNTRAKVREKQLGGKVLKFDSDSDSVQLGTVP